MLRTIENRELLVMASMVSVATAMAILSGAGTIDRAVLPIGGLAYGDLIYKVRAIYEGAGLGGGTPFCANNDEDLLMIVYTVSSGRPIDLSAPAVPRLQIRSPDGY